MFRFLGSEQRCSPIVIGEDMLESVQSTNYLYLGRNRPNKLPQFFVARKISKVSQFKYGSLRVLANSSHVGN